MDGLRLIHWRILLVLWMTAIYLVSSDLLSSRFSADATVEVFGLLNYIVRKCAHMGEFGILTYLWMRSVWTQADRLRVCLTWSVALSLLYAATDEIHQSFVPERLGLWSDVLFDAAGSLLVGYGLWRLWQAGDSGLRTRILGPLCVGSSEGGGPEDLR